MAIFYTPPVAPVLSPPNAAKRYTLYPQPTTLGFLLLLLPWLLRGG